MYQPQDFEKCYIFMTAVIKDYNLKVLFPSLDIHVFNFSMFCQLQEKKITRQIWIMTSWNVRGNKHPPKKTLQLRVANPVILLINTAL